ncbi:MAG: hypothetical protein JXR89_07170 [Deltaproteobacteria bacterium]|nr:hypothetical protein [Deltaproteobacteria bacterium]
MFAKLTQRVMLLLVGTLFLASCQLLDSMEYFKVANTLDYYTLITRHLTLQGFTLSDQSDLPDGGVSMVFEGDPSTTGARFIEIKIDGDRNVTYHRIFDPLILQLPDDVWPTVGTYYSDHGGIQEGPLAMSSVESVLVTPLVKIYPEPGHRLYLLDLPETVDVSEVAGEPRRFTTTLKLYDDQHASGRQYPVKVISSGKVKVDDTTYYLPIYPVVTDFAEIPPIMLGGIYDGAEHDVPLPDMSAFPEPEELYYDLRTPACSWARICFPHVAATAGWQTEFALINDESEKTLAGDLQFYTNFGRLAGAVKIELPPHGRYQTDVEGLLGSGAAAAGYAIFEYCADNRVVGYAKYTQGEVARMAVPAQVIGTPAASEISIPHIASSSEWWTGISLVNTSDQGLTVEIETNVGVSISYEILARGRAWFTFADQFNALPPQYRENLSSAWIVNGENLAGIEIFGSTDASVNHYLSGVPLRSATASTLYYPHTASDAFWWTGVAAYNPAATAARITVTPYSLGGEDLSAGFSGGSLTIAGREKYLGSVTALDFPAGTAWFKLESTLPLTGFELFGQADGSQLAGYTSCNLDRRSGVFPKLEKAGWTGIAFANIGARTEVVLRAYDDAGRLVAASAPLALDAYGKMVDIPENLFADDISSATYICFSADSSIVGFQLNASANGMLLDGLPAL